MGPRLPKVFWLQSQPNPLQADFTFFWDDPAPQEWLLLSAPSPFQSSSAWVPTHQCRYLYGSTTSTQGPPLVQSGSSSVQTLHPLSRSVDTPLAGGHAPCLWSRPLVWSTPTTCLTQVSRQWRVGSRQRGRSAGQDEALPVTGAAAAGKVRQGRWPGQAEA